jgi:DNA polymerase
MSTPQAAFDALIAWWRDAGVEVDAALALRDAPAPPAAAKAASGMPARSKPAAAGPVQAAAAAAAAAQDMAALRAAVEAFDGCALRKSARSTVFTDGVEGAPVMVIGEGPGADEDAKGLPFVGRAGKLLDAMLATIGLSRRDNVLITNVLFWRPPANRTPNPEELAMCRPFVERAIALTQPKLLLLTGGVAGQTLLRKTDGVTRLRGKRFLYENEQLTTPVNAMVMLHPAYLLRQPQDKRLAWADLLAAESWLDELGAPHRKRS